MFWLKQNQRIWRVAGLVLLLVAIAGPWGFDRIDVPEQYPCSPPIVRLEGDFCGVPLSLTWSLQAVFADLRGMVRTLIDYPLALATTLLPLLPVASTLIVLFPGQQTRRLWSHLAALAVLSSAGLGFFLAYWGVRVVWVLWGLWLYVAVTVALLLLELLTFRRHSAPAPSPGRSVT